MIKPVRVYVSHSGPLKKNKRTLYRHQWENKGGLVRRTHKTAGKKTQAGIRITRPSGNIPKQDKTQPKLQLSQQTIVTEDI